MDSARSMGFLEDISARRFFVSHNRGKTALRAIKRVLFRAPDEAMKLKIIMSYKEWPRPYGIGTANMSLQERLEWAMYWLHEGSVVHNTPLTNGIIGFFDTPQIHGNKYIDLGNVDEIRNFDEE